MFAMTRGISVIFIILLIYESEACNCQDCKELSDGIWILNAARNDECPTGCMYEKGGESMCYCDPGNIPYALCDASHSVTTKGPTPRDGEPTGTCCAGITELSNFCQNVAISYSVDTCDCATLKKWATFDPVETPQETIGTDITGSALNSSLITARGKNVDIEKIVNTAMKVWDVVVDNAPVVDAKIDNANGIPKGANLAMLAGWRNKKLGIFKSEWKNLYGFTVCKFHWSIIWDFLGSFNGFGKYVASATTKIEALDVLWGFKLTVKAEEIPPPLNIGALGNPVAEVKLKVTITCESCLKISTVSQIVRVRGDGKWQLQ